MTQPHSITLPPIDLDRPETMTATLRVGPHVLDPNQAEVDERACALYRAIMLDEDPPPALDVNADDPWRLLFDSLDPSERDRWCRRARIALGQFTPEQIESMRSSKLL